MKVNNIKMKAKEIDNGKKLIAEFMGGIEVDWFTDKTILIPYEHQRHLGLPKTINLQNYHTWAKAVGFDELKYNSDWNWLMPVVIEIEKLGFDTKIQFDYNPYSRTKNKMGHWCQIGKDKIAVPDVYGSCYDENKNGKIESIFIAVINFIKWYNKKTKHKK